MNESLDISSQAKLAQDKSKWDAKQKAKEEYSQYVIITDIDIPITKLIGFLVKLAVASVPAGIIALIFWSLVANLLWR
jgi:hypothetical protein